MLAIRQFARTHHHEAVDWASRVITAGGTFTTTTLAAVSKFCRDIDAAGIRSKFYRLNLFCGSDLTAALVPLFRNTSFAGSALGNSTDTNNNFVSGDFVETGSSTGGLKGNGTSKYLNTGFNPSAQSCDKSDFHLWVYVKGTEASGTTRCTIGATASISDPINEAIIGWVSSGSAERASIAGSASGQRRLIGSGALDGSLAITASSGQTLQAYYNGTASSGGTATALGVFANLSIYVCAQNLVGSAAQWSLARYFRAYSIGLSMTSTQASDYHTALKTFNTSLSRNV